MKKTVYITITLVCTTVNLISLCLISLKTTVSITSLIIWLASIIIAFIFVFKSDKEIKKENIENENEAVKNFEAAKEALEAANYYLGLKKENFEKTKLSNTYEYGLICDILDKISKVNIKK